MLTTLPNLFLQNQLPNLFKRDTKRHWFQGIQVSINERPDSFPMEDDRNIVKNGFQLNLPQRLLVLSFKYRQCTFAISLLSPLGKGRGLLFEQN